jgi:hypothetical protein
MVGMVVESAAVELPSVGSAVAESVVPEPVPVDWEVATVESVVAERMAAAEMAAAESVVPEPVMVDWEVAAVESVAAERVVAVAEMVM